MTYSFYSIFVIEEKKFFFLLFVLRLQSIPEFKNIKVHNFIAFLFFEPVLANRKSINHIVSHTLHIYILKIN